jgi:F0F1-type ATP synthase alpha subunit
MAIRSDEITSIIKSAIDAFDSGVETRSVGTVVEVGDGIAQIYGLDGALASEMLRSLVGSEMCIRDWRRSTASTARWRRRCSSSPTG